MVSEDAAEQPGRLVQPSLECYGTLAEPESAVVPADACLNGEQAGAIPATTASVFARSLPETSRPRLFVDWGESPRVGHQCRPEFVLWCPQDQGRPDVAVTIDRELDSQLQEPRVRLKTDGSGLWNFTLPFRMTTQGLDCRPGQYLLELTVTLSNARDRAPQFFRAQIRLKVATNWDGVGGVLEIDGDGQSVVNLQGYDLRQFSKVVLKGGQDGLINLANTTFSSSVAPAPTVEQPPTSFEYELKTDQPRQTRFPVLLKTSQSRSYSDAACFFVGEHRRVFVVAKSRLTFGRSRDNDIVLRFLPRSQDHDRHSANLSRTHFVTELTAEGLEIHDKSKCGVEVNSQIVQDRAVVPAAYVGESVPIELGVTATVAKQLELEMFLLGPARRENDGDLEYLDELVYDLAGGRPSRTTRLALELGIDAIRFERRNNLAEQEAYIQLCREFLIGGSAARCGIVLQQCGSLPQARVRHMDRSFWLETLPLADPISIDGQRLTRPTLVPLSPGQQIVIGSEVIRFDHASQLYLDPE